MKKSEHRKNASNGVVALVWNWQEAALQLAEAEAVEQAKRRHPSARRLPE